jgi:hypothetical protein
MNTHDRFLFSLLSEFKRRAQPQVRSLWADLMELAEATDEKVFSVASEQALRRIRILGRAAGAANASQVQCHNWALEIRLRAFKQESVVVRPELFEGLYETMRELTGALCSIDTESAISKHTSQPTEMALVEACAD